MKEVKSFLPKVNCKIPTAKLNEFYSQVDTRRRNEIGFDDFIKLYQNLILTTSVCMKFVSLTNEIGWLKFSESDFMNGQTTTFLNTVGCRVFRIGLLHP